MRPNLPLLALRALPETHNPPSLEVIRLPTYGVKRKDIKMVNMSENSEGMRRGRDCLSLPAGWQTVQNKCRYGSRFLGGAK
jgi:hypothetical protein